MLVKSIARIDYIDTFRSIGIILMMMGHIPCFGLRFDLNIHKPQFSVI